MHEEMILEEVNKCFINSNETDDFSRQQKLSSKFLKHF